MVGMVVIGFEVVFEWGFCSAACGVFDSDDLLPQILMGDLAGGGPSSLTIDRIDPDRFSGIEPGFITVGLVEDAEATRSTLIGKTPVL